jgi:serine/threonine protein kinase/tetratricopeptide (TPR) repeat protein
MSAELSALFVETWESSSDETDVRGFLEQHPEATGEQRLAVILYDQSRRWKCSKPRMVEDYFSEFPELANDAAFKLKLIISEFQACREADGSITAQDLITRFPELNDDIQQELPQLDLTCQNMPRPVVFNSNFSAATQTEHQTVGRYTLLELIGEGTFGQVRLAWDHDLQRKVAMKLPHPNRLPGPEDTERFLKEARLLAGLKHPNIVGVLDVGRSDGRVCIVFDYIDGQDLAKTLKSRLLEFREAAELIATVATALHYAHTKGLIHCDVKPSNILIEEATRKPFIADFGLAVRETDFAEPGKVVGTPGYMSPEQMRGESHRIDARCDVFALGAILYELLTATHAFRGSTKDEVLSQVIQAEPKPPRQVNGQVPTELERICLKAISKRSSDRYVTAQEMADDLKVWLSPTSSVKLADTSASMVPKGLRSFDASDAHFFLNLLPGPYDRDGLPDSISFWKQRIEESVAERSFAVGLMYGPSGCGKSSLVKAGLMPCLSRNIVTVYVEATADDTENRILQGLRNRMPELALNQNLGETLGNIRIGQGRKVVIFIDQFEQWLHAHRTESDPELVTALRQCDGASLQAIVMVRDDFWLAVSRFMSQMEIDLNPGVNIRLVDLFDTDHAVKVLTRIGQAYQRIPAADADISASQREFLQKAAEGLAEDGRVVSVRLALFGEMVKGKAWQPETLADMGGTEGIGIAFLEETFSSRFANPKHRQHQQAARAVLSALLPEPGTNIRGHMRSQQELQTAAGLKDLTTEFNAVLRILDGELRLITPTDPEGDSHSDSTRNSSLATRYYQLTHDYLVPSLREWLTRKQKETRKGRAELKLEERAGIWNAKPENKQLPTLTEWLTIRLLTNSKSWSNSQKAMMGKAARVHATLLGGIWLAAALLSWAAYSQYELNLRQQTYTTIEALQNSTGVRVPFNLEQLAMFPDHMVLPELRARFRNSDDAGQKLSLAFGLAHYGELDATYLISRIDDITEPDTRAFVTAIKADPATAIAVLKSEASKCANKLLWRRRAKLSVAALALGRPELAQDMCTFENRPDPEQRTLFIDEFRNWDLDLNVVLDAVRDSDSPALRSGICLAVGQIPVKNVTDAEMRAWTLVAAKWFENQSDTSTHSATGWMLRHWNLPLPEIPKPHEILPTRDWFVVKASGATMLRIHPELLTHATASPDPLERYRQQLVELENAEAAELENSETRFKRATAFYHTGELHRALEDLTLLTQKESGQTLSEILRYRTLTLARLGKTDEARQSLVQYREQEDSPSHKTYVEILVSAWLGDIPEASRQLEAASIDASANEVAMYNLACAAALCAQITAEDDQSRSLEFVNRALDLLRIAVSRGYRNATKAREDPDFAVLLNVPGFSSIVADMDRSVRHEFWVSDWEVTRRQFDQFINDANYNTTEKPLDWGDVDGSVSPTLDHPVQQVSWYDAVLYCNWLSWREQLTPCYERTSTNHEDSDKEAKQEEWRLVPGANGYRLPDENELEFVCRAGTSTQFSTGDDETLLGDYCQMYPSQQTSPCGLKLPNSWGLNDVHGNVGEWCWGCFGEMQDQRLLQGGAYDFNAWTNRSGNRMLAPPDYRYNSTGFRICRASLPNVLVDPASSEKAQSIQQD